MVKIDLHMHSTASDGEKSPEELVDWAVQKGMRVFAITDHDVVRGSRRAVEYAMGRGVEVVSGVEFGSNDEELELYDVHIVGLFLDLDDEGVRELSRDMMRAREVQKREIIERLNELGYEISFEELRAEVDGDNYGRPHVARILLRKYPEEFVSMQDVFDKLLGGNGRAYVRQRKRSIGEVVDVIHSAGGLAILAHPMLCGKVDEVVDKFVERGGDGVEVDYCYVNRNRGREESLELCEEVRKIAEERGLVVSGGGDFHRLSDGWEIGEFGLSEDEFLVLKKYWKERWKKN